MNKISMLIISFLGLVQFGLAQEDLYIYKVKGEPYIEVNDSIKSVRRGTVIEPSTKLILSKDDIVHFIDEAGDLFEVYQTGTFSYNQLLSLPAITENTSLTRKMFIYLWKEMTNTMAKRNKKSGVVYRGDAITDLLYPMDSVAVYSGEIRFEWKPIKDKEKDYYLILRNPETGATTIIGTPAASLSLGLDEGLLMPGKTYEWTITETRFPNLKKTPFNSFRIMTEDEFKSRQGEIKELQAFYKKLGLTKAETRQAICQDFKICY